MNDCLIVKIIKVSSFFCLISLGLNFDCQAAKRGQRQGQQRQGSKGSNGHQWRASTETRDTLEAAEKAIDNVRDENTKDALKAVLKAMHEVNKKADLAHIKSHWMGRQMGGKGQGKQRGSHH
jgi:hypothetical protein